MKNIKLTIYIVLLSLGFIACNSETTDPVIGTPTSTSQVEIGFSGSNDNAGILEDGGQASASVGITKSLPFDVIVELEITSSDGSLEDDAGQAELTYDKMVTISAGSTSANANFSFIDDGKSDGAETYTVKIKNATTSVTSTEYFITASSDLEQQSRVFTVYDQLPDVIDTTAGSVQIDLMWTESSRDMDFYILNAPEPLNSNVVDRSEGFTTTESVDLPEAAGDITYYLYVNQYFFTADVDYTIDFTFPDGQTINYTGTVTQDSNVMSLAKVTDGDTVTYTITKL
ncbi:hypothetical protein SAMN04489761_3139 [Tenacibaculum sp. MAR_2009_124]|uniref:hypothetical protein n=1 Tax=Tenacibaculum sp. MAR_2009_124 TaxID=1250059 RepID=UPI00089ADED7|nr:hypothetical protein [Tenacibaculum sp. MAR_2009_124]SEC49125.1 hypothetical protein SAMN04489761_3139 [Tenacibaculum sp. MAR_2009_124]